MDAVKKLLDKAKKMCSADSDNAFAKRLKVSRQRVSNWRHGLNYPDEIACAQIAEITGEKLAFVLGVVGEARAISSDAKAVWRKLATAAILVVALTPAGAIAGKMGDALQGPKSGISTAPVYVLCEICANLRRRRKPKRPKSWPLRVRSKTRLVRVFLWVAL